MSTSETLLACLLVAGIAGALSAVATRSLLDDAPRVPAASAPAVERTGVPPEESGGEWLAELDGLRLENAALEQRVLELEQRVALANARVPGSTSPEQPVAESDAHPQASARRALTEDASELDPVFLSSVERAVAEIRAREESEREERRRASQGERIEERVADLRETLGLSASQVQDMRAVLLTQDEERERLIDWARDGGARRGLLDEMHQLRERTHVVLEGFLTSEQLALYKENELAEFRRFGPRSDGPDVPGGGQRDPQRDPWNDRGR